MSAAVPTAKRRTSFQGGCRIFKGVTTTAHRPRVGILSSALGEQVRRRRLELGLSQTALAERAFISQSAVSKLELGGLPRDAGVLDRVAIALGAKDSDWADADLFRLFRHCAELDARHHDHDDLVGATI
jgi:ribosome-binding protein aMBF1 (putative translation factor)